MTTTRNTAINILEKRIKLINARMETIQEYLTSDPKLFIRSYTEEYYSMIQDLDQLTDILNYINNQTENDDQVISYLNNIKTGYLDFLVRRPLMESSSSPMHSLTTLWDNDSTQRIIRLIDNILL
jgi:hypothetical protein